MFWCFECPVARVALSGLDAVIACRIVLGGPVPGPAYAGGSSTSSRVADTHSAWNHTPRGAGVAGGTMGRSTPFPAQGKQAGFATKTIRTNNNSKNDNNCSNATCCGGGGVSKSINVQCPILQGHTEALPAVCGTHATMCGLALLKHARNCHNKGLGPQTGQEATQKNGSHGLRHHVWHVQPTRAEPHVCGYRRTLSLSHRRQHPTCTACAAATSMATQRATTVSTRHPAGVPFTARDVS